MTEIGDKYVVTMYYYAAADVVHQNAFANTFAYEGTGGAPSAEDLRDAFQTDVMAPLFDNLSTGVIADLLTVINLDDPIDFSTIVSNEVGIQGGDWLPLFNAYEFQYVRTSRAVHNGRKSFSGVPESAQVNGTVVLATKEALDNLAVILGNPITGVTGTYTPRIWRRAGNYGDPPVAFPDQFYAISQVVYNRISTQNTRKR